MIVVLASAACALAALGVVLGVQGRPAPRRPVTRGRARSAVLLALGVVVATTAFAATALPPAARVPLVTVAVLLGPGYAVLAFRDLSDAVLELGLALGAGLALLVLAGTAMVTLGVWEPLLLAAAASVVIAPVLTWRGTLGLAATRRETPLGRSGASDKGSDRERSDVPPGADAGGSNTRSGAAATAPSGAAAGGVSADDSGVESPAESTVLTATESPDPPDPARRVGTWRWRRPGRR